MYVGFCFSCFWLLVAVQSIACKDLSPKCIEWHVEPYTLTHSPVMFTPVFLALSGLGAVIRSRPFPVRIAQNASNAVVTCEIKLFQPSSTSLRNCFISARGNLPEIILILSHRLIAAREYFPKCSLTLK